MHLLNETEILFDAHNGIMRTADLNKAHIFYKDIQTLVAQGMIEKIKYGYYQWVNYDNFSEISTIIRLFPDAILCMDTALFNYRYSDRTPMQWHLAVSKNSGKSRFKIDYPFVKPYYIEPTLLYLGITEVEIDGSFVQIYDKERTICDCLRYVNKIDKEMFNKAIRSYIDDSTKDIPRLLQYAKQLRVTQKVKALIGIWM